jgi:hypothetical protein
VERTNVVKEIAIILPTAVDRIVGGYWGNTFIGDGTELKSLMEKHDEIKARSERESFWSGLLDKLSKKIDGFSASSELTSKAEAVAGKAADMWERGDMPRDESLHKIALTLRNIFQRLTVLEDEIKALENTSIRLKGIWQQHETNLKVARQDCASSEQLQWGMAEL